MAFCGNAQLEALGFYNLFNKNYSYFKISRKLFYINKETLSFPKLLTSSAYEAEFSKILKKSLETCSFFKTPLPLDKISFLSNSINLIKLCTTNIYSKSQSYPSGKKSRFFDSKGSINFHRRFYSSDNYQLLNLEKTANKNKQDATCQAEYLKEVVILDPQYVIRRFESGLYASNQEVRSIYLMALGLANNSVSLKSIPNKNSSTYIPKGVSWSETAGLSLAGFVGSILKFAVYGTIFYLVYKLFESKVSINMDMYSKDFVEEKNVSTRFNDVKGCNEVKDELIEIVDFLKNPHKYTRLGGRISNGVLLIGPPGTGKTMLARAVAGEAGVPFFSCSGSEFEEMFVGVGASRIRKLFAKARESAPAIIFIDELDAIGGKRTANDLQPYSRMTLNQLLVELDGFKKTEGVVLIGATNFSENLDKALLRAGRFDTKVHVSLPTHKDRVEIIKYYLSKIFCSKELNIERLSQLTIGMSGADISNVINQSAVRASTLNDNIVEMSHFEWAREKIALGRERKSLEMTDLERKMTAYHEAGHAVVARFTDGARKLHKVTILPRGSALGVTELLPEKDEISSNKKQLLSSIEVCLGGRLAEEIYFGSDNITTGASSDLTNATHIAESMVRNYGFSDQIGLMNVDTNKNKWSPKTEAIIDSEVKKILKEANERVRNTLQNHSEEHRRLADALYKYDTLESEDIELAIQGKIV